MNMPAAEPVGRGKVALSPAEVIGDCESNTDEPNVIAAETSMIGGGGK
jgi:hypothetical protein